LKFAGVLGCYWGFRAGYLETTQALEESTNVKMMSILWLVVMWLFAGYSLLVLRSHKNKCVHRSYTFFMFFWTAVFIGIAVMAPSEGGIYYSFQI